MSEELVCYVDEQGNIIKPIPISLANSDTKYLHLEVAILIVDRDKRVLLQKRAKTKKVAPGIWIVAAAGHVTYGDTIDDTAHRELKEEMGFDVKLSPLFPELVELENERHIAHWYIGVYDGSQIVAQKEEVDEYLWIKEVELENFCKTHEVSTRTVKVMQDFWSGKWDNLLSSN